MLLMLNDAIKHLQKNKKISETIKNNCSTTKNFKNPHIVDIKSVIYIYIKKIYNINI